MIKVTVLHPNADLAYNREHHVAFTAALPELRRYHVQEIFPDPMTGKPPAYNLINELWYDDIEAYKRSFSSPELDVAVADVVNFSDFSKAVTLISEEREIPL